MPASIWSTSTASTAGLLERAGEGRVVAAAGRALDADDIDFTGVALHAGLDAHANTGFAVGRCAGALQTRGQDTGQRIQALPRSGEFTDLRALLVDLETVVGEELIGHRPDFGRRALGQDPVGITAFLQGEVAGLGGHLQRQRARHFELGLGRGLVGDVARDRQQRIQALVGSDAGRQLHGCCLGRFQVIIATIAEVTVFAPEPPTTAGARNDQCKGGQASQSLHAVYFLN
jgi:hypothetical protein